MPANTLIGVDVIGLVELRREFEKMPHEVKVGIADDVAKYLQNVFRTYAPYRYVSLGEAYGGFRSEKQRRFFFAALADGRIKVPYKRTQKLAKGWKIVGKGEGAILVNEVSYAGYVQGEGSQANMMRLIGWKTTDQEIKDREKEIQRKAEASVKKTLKRLKLN